MDIIQQNKVSVIMPMYNHWDLSHARLMEFRTYLPSNCEIVLVDDCSTDEDVRSGTAFWQKSSVALHPIKYIRNQQNLGFTKSLNRGYKVSSGDVVIFYSNDVVMKGNVVQEVLNAINTSDKKVLVGDRSVYWAAGWNEFEANGKKVIPYLEGYFIACKRDVWEELGGWDERYSPYDYEDMDISLHAFLLGYNLIALQSRLITHIGGQTVYTLNPQREETTKRNRIQFIEKWSRELSEL